MSDAKPVSERDIAVLRADCIKALTCLYVAVDEAVATDVEMRVGRYVRALELQQATAVAEATAPLVEALKEINELGCTSRFTLPFVMAEKAREALTTHGVNS